jgi:sigma-B regulation protein RsbU (phosphoserine phosphatase)
LPRLRFWNTLTFRVALVVNATIIGVLGTFALTDYRRERALLIGQEIERLGEEAKVLAVARVHFPETEDFQRFIDDFCRQMSSAASPGHHIIIFDQAGITLLRAHERSNPGLEAKMATAAESQVDSFEHDGVVYLSVNVQTSDGATVSVAQSAAVIQHLITSQGISRATSMGILVGLIVAVTTLGLLVWVQRPLRELVTGVAAVGRGHFDVHVSSRGSGELRLLADGVNQMARSLNQVEFRRKEEMKRARVIQRGLLPRDVHRIEGFELVAAFLPTDSVGGDLYDIVPLTDSSTLLVVMDVSGHGVPAALYTALLRTVVHHQASATSDITRIARAMNREFSSIASAGEFATCYLARLVNTSGIIEYLSAGHDPAVVVRPDGSAEVLAGNGLPLGIDSETSYQSNRGRLVPGDRLFLFTDGLHEASDGHGRPLGRPRLVNLLVRTANLGLREQLEAVIREVRSFQRRARFDDDVTLLCIGHR